MDKFNDCITRAISLPYIANEYKRIYGEKPDGEKFCFVITGFAWYAVRLYYESECNNECAKADDHPVQKLTLCACCEYIEEHKNRLEGQTDNFENAVELFVKTNSLEPSVIQKTKDITYSGQHFEVISCEIDATRHGYLFLDESKLGSRKPYFIKFRDNAQKLRATKIINHLKQNNGDYALANLNNMLEHERWIEVSQMPNIQKIPEKYINDLDVYLTPGQAVGTKKPSDNSLVFGIYVGNNEIIHVTKDVDSDNPLQVHKSNIQSQFSNTSHLDFYLANFWYRPYSFSEVANRAEQFLKTGELPNGNRQPFALDEGNYAAFSTFCSTGVQNMNELLLSNQRKV